MKLERLDEWLTRVEPGDMLQVIREAPLYPQSMWTQLSDDTWILSMPVLEPGDHVITLDVMHDDRDIDNALVRLNSGGTIVMYDCDPPSKEHQRVPQGNQRGWCGNVWGRLTSSFARSLI